MRWRKRLSVACELIWKRTWYKHAKESQTKRNKETNLNLIRTLISIFINNWTRSLKRLCELHVPHFLRPNYKLKSCQLTVTSYVYVSRISWLIKFRRRGTKKISAGTKIKSDSCILKRFPVETANRLIRTVIV